MKKILAPPKKQRGFILTIEFILFVTILVIGLIVGWVTMRDSFNAELVDTANAIESSIKFYYFNDPDRGNGPAFTPDSIEFFQPGGSEGLPVLDLDNPPASSPTGSINLPSSPTGTTTPIQ